MMTDPNSLASPFQRAFAQAYATGFPMTIRFLISRGAKFELAEEVAQQAWVRGWEALAQLRSVHQTQSWVNSIAYHRLCNHRQRAPRNVPITEVPDRREPAILASLDAALLLKGCTPAERALLEQRYVAGMNLAEIASEQGLTEMTVRLRIHRCHHRLRAVATSTR
jgi:RNA polymerase sigma factor (sigma-70 family)